jgi:hypothetical protein
MRLSGMRVLLAIIVLLMLADFVFRGLIPATTAGKTDFSELYVGGWLWRHGQNYYDAALATRTAARITFSNMPVAVVYPPTAFPLIAPLTFFPWNWANLIWLLIGSVGIAVTIGVLIRLGRFRNWEDRTLILATFILAFAPLHEAFHLGNMALVAVPLCLLGIDYAEQRRDLLAGVLLGISIALKPQLGLWILLFYLIQRRKRIFLGALGPGIVISIVLLLYPVPFRELMRAYQQNYQYWFGPGRPFGFTEGAYPFHVNVVQVVLYQLLHNASLTNKLAHGTFLAGLAIWGGAVFRGRSRVPTPLVLSSLVALTFISLYHTVNDVTFLTLALCWAFGGDEEMTWPKRLTCAVFVLMMLPGHSVLMRSMPYLGSSILSSWWWNIFVARYFVWLLFALNGVLLYSLVSSTFGLHSQGQHDLSVVHKEAAINVP